VSFLEGIETNATKASDRDVRQQGVDLIRFMRRIEDERIADQFGK